MKTNRLIILFLLLLFTISNYSCTNDSEDDLIVSSDPEDDDQNDDDPDSSSTVNYNDDVRLIMQTSCVGCHSSPPVNGAPFALVNFNQVSQRASSILNVMNKQSGTANAMPPSGRLPQSTINIIQEWIAEGKPEN